MQENYSADYDFKELEALIRIVYQIRCNMFHGGKHGERDRFQMDRDKKLAKSGAEIVEKLWPQSASSENAKANRFTRLRLISAKKFLNRKM